MQGFSVVMPNWNRADWMPRSIESVLTQEGVEVEVIIIDDASTDNSLQVAREFKTKYPGKIRIFETHESLTYNICLPANIGFLRARYDLVVLNPSDTHHLLPTNFKTYEALIAKNPNAFADPHITAGGYKGKKIAQAGGCLRREHIHKIQGFDERMHGWGSNEPDLVSRLKMIEVSFVKCSAQVGHSKGKGPWRDFEQRNAQLSSENAANHCYAPNAIHGKTWGEHPQLEEIT